MKIRSLLVLLAGALLALPLVGCGEKTDDAGASTLPVNNPAPSEQQKAAQAQLDATPNPKGGETPLQDGATTPSGGGEGAAGSK